MSDVVSRYVSVGDVTDGGDMELCGVDTVLSGADSGVCVNLTGCQVLTPWCQVLTLTGCQEV